MDYENQTAPVETDAETIKRLAALSPIEFDRCRKTEADKLGCKVSTLEAAVKKECGEFNGSNDNNGQGKALEFPELEPWPDEVNGEDLLNDISAIIKRHVVLPEEAADAVALWVIHTFAYDLGRITPILAIYSPKARCGKSTLLAILLSAVSKPMGASNISSASIYRVISSVAPTLLIDEADSFIKASEEIRGVINSGHTRDLANVIKTVVVGDGYEVRTFSTWAPKAIALIGRLQPTLHDRSIVIELARKMPLEKVERIPKSGLCLLDIQRRCTRFVADNSEEISKSTPMEVNGLHDRASDNWDPLFTLADIAGGEWPDKARKSALKLSEGNEDDSYTATLLTDIRDYFNANELAENVFSKDLVELLIKLEERPWSEWKNSKALTQNQLARLLKPFKIKSGTVRIGYDTQKGYTREAFEKVFIRYLPVPPPKNAVTPSQPTDDVPYSAFQSVTNIKSVTFQNRLQATDDAECDVVTVQIRGDTAKGDNYRFKEDF